MNFNQDQIKQLESFVQACQQSPEILYLDELSFFRHYLQSLGAKIPPKTTTKREEAKEEVNKEEKKEPSENLDESESDEIIESDLDLDMTGVIEEDNDDPLPMGDDSKEVTEEEMDKSDEKRSEAMQAISEDDCEKAITLFGEAIELNPVSAALFAKRANCLLRLNKPNACIRDCDQAIKLNPDNAQAYKYRGRAYRFLGKWEEAARDLATACKIDYDDQANEWLKEVQPNAKKLHDHKRKYERLYEEKKIKEQQERIRKIREEHERAAKQESTATSDGTPGGMPGGMPDLSFILNDPEIMQALQDPEIAAAFQDISTNPANFMKYQSNPKVASLMAKMAQKMGGPGGGPKFPGGGFPGFSP